MEYLTPATLAKLNRWKPQARAYAPTVPATLTAPKVSKSIKRYVKRAIDADNEMKQKGVQFNGTTTAYDGTIFTDLTAIVNDIDQADAEGRTGDSLRVHSITIRAQIDTQTTAGDQFRILAFQWHKDNNVDAPALADLFFASGANSVNSPFEIDGEQYFKILYDKRIVLSSTNLEPLVNIRLKGKRMNLVKFNAQGVTVGKDHIYFAILGQEAVAGTPASYNGYADVRFKN